MTAAQDSADAGRRRRETPLLAEGSIAGRSLVIVVAIMTFLAAMTAGTVELIASASSAWRADISREVTIQVRPRTGRDIERDVERAAQLARRTPGVSEVRVATRQDSERLLQPWLGSGLDIGELPVPRLIELRISADRISVSSGGSCWSRRRGPRSTIIASGCSASAPWRAHRRGGPVHPFARAGGDGARHRLRDAGGDGWQPSDHRGAQSRRRFGQLHRAGVPAAFPAPRPPWRGLSAAWARCSCSGRQVC